jgi:hypothetical protein
MILARRCYAAVTRIADRKTRPPFPPRWDEARGGLIVTRWLGWCAPNLGEAEALKLWDIVQLGLGGHVIGRSAEKVLPVLVDVGASDSIAAGVGHAVLSRG